MIRLRSKRAATCMFALIGIAMAAVAKAETPRERGAYLVNVLAACANCHTAKTPTGPGPALSGGSKFGAPEAPVFAANITPDPATGIGNWTDSQIAASIERGVRPDGSRIGPPMPQMAYHAISEADARAIVAYLRSVPPVSHAVPASIHKMLPAAEGDSTRPWHFPDTLEGKGRYIAMALSHCTECHTPVPLSTPDVATRLDVGGRLFHTAKGTIEAPAIRANDLKRFSDSELALIITQGIRPDGHKIAGPMPVKSYAGYRPGDLAALIAFLRSDQSISKR